MQRLQLVGTQESELVVADEVGSLRLVLPCRLSGVGGALCENDVIRLKFLVYDSLGVGGDILVPLDRFGRRKSRDDVGIAAVKIPELVQVAVRQDDESTVLRARILSGLFLPDEWVLVLCFGLENDQGEAAGIEQEEVHEALLKLLEIAAKGFDVCWLDGYRWFEADVRRRSAFGEEAPTGCFKQLVDFDASGGFLLAQSRLSRLNGPLSLLIAPQMDSLEQPCSWIILGLSRLEVPDHARDGAVFGHRHHRR